MSESMSIELIMSGLNYYYIIDTWLAITFFLFTFLSSFYIFIDLSDRSFDKGPECLMSSSLPANSLNIRYANFCLLVAYTLIYSTSMQTFFFTYKFNPDFVTITELENIRFVSCCLLSSTRETSKSGNNVNILIWLFENYELVIPF